MVKNDSIINFKDRILITGSNGFIGSKVVKTLLRHGFVNLRCFVRPSGDLTALNKIVHPYFDADVKLLKGNLLSRDDCKRAVEDVSVIFHLAAGMDKSFAGAYMNSVVTTRNLLEAALNEKALRRFVNVSSFAVYDCRGKRRHSILDETNRVENDPQERGEAYCFGKAKQEALVMEYGEKYAVPYVNVRPGAVFGPGKKGITGRVGIDTFGIFLHMGGSNKVPLTYVDNCAEAIVLAGVRKGVDGEIFNVVDDNLPTSRQFLRMYKKNVNKFKSLYVPKLLSYLLCSCWEKYSKWSEGQLPPVFNRSRWSTEWKSIRYSNAKLKKLLEWKPKIPMDEALRRYFQYQKEGFFQE